MNTEEQEKRILRVLADDWDKNPGSRAKGIPLNQLGALVGAYLNNPIYSVANLRRKGLVSKIGNNIILTDIGYSSVRPFIKHGFTWFNLSNPWVYVILTIIAGVIVGIFLMLMQDQDSNTNMKIIALNYNYYIKAKFGGDNGRYI